MVENSVDDYFDKLNCKIVKEDLQRLKHVEKVFDEWVQFQQHFPKNYDKKMLQSFIRGSNYNLEITKKKFSNYFSTKYLFPEIYFSRSPNSANFQNLTKIIQIFVLPTLTEKGERVHIFSMFPHDPQDFDLLLAIKLFFMHYDLLLTQTAPVSGEITIFICSTFTALHFTKFLSVHFKNAITILREGYACRLTQIHFVQPPQLVEKLLGIISPLIHYKLRDRIICHKSMAGLSDHISANILPVDFGGTNPQTALNLTKSWYKTIRENFKWFQGQEEVVVTAEEKLKAKREFNCLEGSFRKLNID